MAKITQVALIGLGVVSFVFIAACLGGNVWTKGKRVVPVGPRHKVTVSVTAGLWKFCARGNCKDLSDMIKIEDWRKAVRAFVVIACLLSIGATVTAIASMFVEKVKSLIPAILFLGAAICMVIGLATYVAKIKKTPGGSMGWSYILGWIGTVISGAGFIMGIIAGRS